jgi:hypothetical protein
MHVRVKSESRSEYQFQNYKKGMKIRIKQEYPKYYIGTVVQPKYVKTEAGIPIKNWVHDTTIAVHKNDCFELKNKRNENTN